MTRLTTSSFTASSATERGGRESFVVSPERASAVNHSEQASVLTLRIGQVFLVQGVRGFWRVSSDGIEHDSLGRLTDYSAMGVNDGYQQSTVLHPPHTPSLSTAPTIIDDEAEEPRDAERREKPDIAATRLPSIQRNQTDEDVAAASVLPEQIHWDFSVGFSLEQVFGKKGKVVEYTGSIKLWGSAKGSLRGTVIFCGTFQIAGSAEMDMSEFPESKFEKRVQMAGSSKIIIKEGTDPFTLHYDRSGTAAIEER
jgi:hypothetical protein